MPADDHAISQILGDRDKRIAGDLRWLPDDSGGHEFLAAVLCHNAELVVRGQRCPAANTLRFSLILRGVGRIAALDLGHAHTTCPGELHFHRWQPSLRDRHAEPPGELPTTLSAAWQLFCRLTRIQHPGLLLDPPPAQETHL